MTGADPFTVVRCAHVEVVLASSNAAGCMARCKPRRFLGLLEFSESL